VIFTSILLWDLVSHLGSVTDINSCTSSNLGEISVSLLYNHVTTVNDGRYRKPHISNKKEIVNDCNYDGSSSVTSLPDFHFENFQHSNFVA
jgi:hypothetical protein